MGRTNKQKVEKTTIQTPKEEAPIIENEIVEETPVVDTPPSRDIPDKYNLAVTIDGETFTASTNDLVDAFLSLEPKKINSKVLIKITTADNKSAERWLYPVRARRLFTNRMFAQIYCKQLDMFFIK